jgi:hypothetical protein
MIVNKKEYEILKEISKITLTDYNITLVEQDKYWVPENSVMNIIEDLKYEYDHIEEELEDCKSNYNDQIDLDYYYDMQKERKLLNGENV